MIDKQEMLNNSNAKIWNALDNSEVAKEAILTGYSNTKDFHPTELSEKFYSPLRQSVLDFGCGLGRNFSILNSRYKTVDAFDLPNMLKMMPIDVKTSVNLVSDEWNIIREKKYNCIHACLVLQHIDEKYLREYLNDFVKMSEFLIIASRSYLDDNYKNIFSILKEFYNVEVLSDVTEEKCLNAKVEEHLHFNALLRRK